MENAKTKVKIPKYENYLKLTKKNFHEYNLLKVKKEYEAVKRLTMQYFQLISMSSSKTRFL